MCLTCTEFTVQWENKDLNESKDLKMIADVINLVYRALTVFILTDVVYRIFRSSRPEVFCKKGVLKSFAKFTEKHLCKSLFLNKVADQWPATLFKKRLWNRCFPVDFAKFLRLFFFRTPLMAASEYFFHLNLGLD